MDKEKQDIFLYVENVNFSEHSYEDWNQTSFTFFRDGTLKIKKVYGSSVQEDIIQTRKSDYIYIKNLMSSIMNNPPREKVDADDGDAWSFAFYDEKGKLIFDWDTDYTYGIKKFEKLQDKLCSFMPDWVKRYRGSILEK